MHLQLVDLSYDHYSMWSIIQGGNLAPVVINYQFQILIIIYISGLFGGQYSGQDMSQSSIREKTFVSMLNPVYGRIQIKTLWS